MNEEEKKLPEELETSGKEPADPFEQQVPDTDAVGSEKDIVPEQGLDLDNYDKTAPFVKGERVADTMTGLPIDYDLTPEEVTKACVETVAENTSDGVTAPLLYLMIGGVPLGFCYKAINTLDSMVGYRNAKYLHLGRASAKLDDAANWLPSRICGLLLTVSAFLLRLDGKNAWRIFRRDRRNHLSPNSAQTESAAAGALGIQLGGTHIYFGDVVEKPTIGDAVRLAEPEDIRRTNGMMFAASGLSLLGFGLLRFAAVLLFR